MEREEIQLAWADYINHMENCPAKWHGEFPPTGSCDCGLDEMEEKILAAFDALREEQDELKRAGRSAVDEGLRLALVVTDLESRVALADALAEAVENLKPCEENFLSGVVVNKMAIEKINKALVAYQAEV